MSWIPATGDMAELNAHIASRLADMLAERDRKMAGKRYYVRNDRGGGVIFKTAEEADTWVKNNPSYSRVTREEIDADQKAADEEVAAKAQEQAEDKAVSQPRRSRG